MPKCISTFSGKNKAVVIHGVCASRYHSVFWSPDSLFTCGLNAGALGHIKGDRTVITPKEVLNPVLTELFHVPSFNGFCCRFPFVGHHFFG